MTPSRDGAGALPPVSSHRLEPTSVSLPPANCLRSQVSQERYHEIPKPVLDVYRQWRPSPLYRARNLEKALGLHGPKIYYKYSARARARARPPFSCFCAAC